MTGDEVAASPCSGRRTRANRSRLKSLNPASFMNILLLGSGGREHALAWKIAASPLVTKLWCAPGNAGIAREAECVAVDITDHPAVIEFCKANKVDFVVVGPDAPIAAGIVDDLNAAGFKAFGPTRAAGQLESSKSFTKALCRANNIPTAAYEHFTDADKAKAYIRAQGAPIVVKADGLAAGKGVVVAMTEARGARRGRHDVRRRFRRGRRRGRGRGVHGRRGSLVLRAVRRRARAAARHRAGPQARLRRRPGPEHRRHGRLFAGPGDDRDDLRAGHGRR